MKPEIRKDLYEESPGFGQSVVRAQSYVGTGVRRVESRFIQRESDHSDANARRFSEDNGRTWSDWEGFTAPSTSSRGVNEPALHTLKSGGDPMRTATGSRCRRSSRKDERHELACRRAQSRVAL